MSKQLTQEEFLEKLSDKCREAIEIISFNGSAKPLVAKIKATGEIRTWTMANQLFRNTTGTFKPVRGKVHNSWTKEDYQRKIDKKFGQGVLEVLEFKSFGAPIKVKCLNCGEIKEFASGAHFDGTDCACQKCFNMKKTKEECQEEIDKIFGNGEFIITSFTKAS